MPKPDLDQKLKKFNISDERLSSEKGTLLQLGFNETQAIRLIVRMSSSNTIKKLLSEHNWLIKHFTHEQIVRIAGNNGGARNIAAIKDAFTVLQTLGFSA